MNKRILGLAVSLLAVAIMVLPMPAAFATPSTEITGTTKMINPMNYVTMRPLGDSGLQIFTFANAPFEIHGDIEGTGLYYGVWLMKPSDGFPPFELVVAKGVYYLDVEVNGPVES